MLSCSKWNSVILADVSQQTSLREQRGLLPPPQAAERPETDGQSVEFALAAKSCTSKLTMGADKTVIRHVNKLIHNQ